MAEEHIDAQGAGTGTAQQQEKTYTQAEIDNIVEARLNRERKKYPSEDEMNAYRNWKGDRAAEQRREAAYTKAQEDLEAATRELEQLKREKYVLSKGLTGDEAEFIAFKALKLVDDKTTFEQAVDQLTASRVNTKVDWTAPVGGGSKEETANAAMNNLIRGAFK